MEYSVYQNATGVVSQPVIVSEVFDGIRIENEVLLWADKQSSDYLKVQKTIKLGVSLSVLMLLFALTAVLTYVFVVSLKNNGALSIQSASWLIGALTTGLMTISGLMSIAGIFIVTNMHMFITDRRIILFNPRMGIKRIFVGRPFQELSVVNHDKFLTLKASGYVNSENEGHSLKIRGLADAHKAEELIQKYFMEF